MNKRTKYEINYNIFSNTTYLLKYGFLVLLFLLFANSNSFAQTQEISDIFIESTGNNKFEAKIKAHEQGMLRSIFLLISKLKLPTDDIKSIPYPKLKSVFTPIFVQNEVSLIDKYSATVTYSYDKEKLYQLILEYGDSKINDQFYEYIIIPVFKQKNIMNIWESDKRWNDKWSQHRASLEEHKIYYPTKNLYLAQKINVNNLLKLNLQEFVNIFHNLLFKNVVIVTAELFTNRKTSETTMQVKKYILKAGNLQPIIMEEEYNLNTQEDIPRTTEIIINKLITNYGILRSNFVDDKALKENIVKEEVKKPIIMNFDIFDKEELDLLVAKLKKVKEIDRFVVEHDYNTRYKILIYTEVDEYQLAESMYLRGLSYRIHGELYNLIDIKKGG